MNTSANTRPDTDHAQVHLQPDAQQTPPARVKFIRVLVRRSAASDHTTISLSEDVYVKALHWAHGQPGVVTAAMRKAALRIEDKRTGYFSRQVRTKALEILRGNYRPAEALLSAENTQAWSGTD
jgi:hypothetical protein